MALEGHRNRIAVARGRYIQAVQEYNVLASQLPDQPDRHGVRHKPKENFSVTPTGRHLHRAARDFGNTPATAAASR